MKAIFADRLLRAETRLCSGVGRGAPPAIWAVRFAGLASVTVVAGILIVASIAKSMHQSDLAEGIRTGLGVTASVSQAIGAAVVATEMALGLSLLLFRNSRFLLIAAMVLFAVFTVWLVYMSKKAPGAACGCVPLRLSHESVSVTVAIWRNVFLIGLCAGAFFASGIGRDCTPRS